MRNQWVRALAGLGGGLLLFLGIAWSLRRALDAAESRSAVVSQIVLKATLIVVALAG
jgi:hypothetical protein